MMFPKRIEDMVKNIPFTTSDEGRSGDMVYMFEKKYILKVSKDLEVLKRESDKMEWLSSKGLCVKPILSFMEDGMYYYLREFQNGYSLLDEKFIQNPLLLVDILVDVIKRLRALDKECPFSSHLTKGESFIHGDLCLPNIYVDENGGFLGLIDLDNSGLGDPWWDYAWLIWTLNYNLKDEKYSKLLLEKLGISFDEEKYNTYTKMD